MVVGKVGVSRFLASVLRGFGRESFALPLFPLTTFIIVEVLRVVTFVGSEDQVGFSRGKIKDHLREVGVGPREPRSSVVRRIVDVLTLVDQAKSGGVLPWYVSWLFPTTKRSDLRLRWYIGRPRFLRHRRCRISKTPMTSAYETGESGKAVKCVA